MKPTEGPWEMMEVEPSRIEGVWEIGLKANDFIREHVVVYGLAENDPEMEADALFIVTAFNTARSINPDNPIAAAREIANIFYLLDEAATEGCVSKKTWLKEASEAISRALEKE